MNGAGLTEVQRELEPSGLIFKDTVYMTVQYSDQDVEGIDESDLKPYFYTDDLTGSSAGAFGGSIKVISQDTLANTITFSMPHFSMFRLASGMIASPVKLRPVLVSGGSGLKTVRNSYGMPVTIAFSVGAEDAGSGAEIEIYNSNGQLVKRLLNRKFVPGLHSVVWDGSSGKRGRAGSGSYIVRLSVGEKNFYKNVVILHKGN